MSFPLNELIQLNINIETEIYINYTMTMHFMQEMNRILNQLYCELNEYNHTCESIIQQSYQERPEFDLTDISLLNNKRQREDNDNNKMINGNDSEVVVRTVQNKKVVYTLRSNQANKVRYKEEDDDDDSDSDSDINDDDDDCSNDSIGIGIGVGCSNGNRHNSKKKKAKSKINRKSKYRGVSKNGNQWQALIMVNKKKKYIGVYATEEKAGRAYDIAAIQNHGDKAKTNFMYSTNEINNIKSRLYLLD